METMHTLKLKCPPKIYRMFQHAYTAALTSDGVGGGDFKHGAILAKGKRIVSAGNNSYKTHPLLIKHTEFPFLHAEQHVIFKYGLDNIDGLDLYVLRVRRDGFLGESKPCEVCQIFLDKLNKVCYTTYNEQGWDIL